MFSIHYTPFRSRLVLFGLSSKIQCSYIAFLFLINQPNDRERKDVSMVKMLFLIEYNREIKNKRHRRLL